MQGGIQLDFSYLPLSPPKAESTLFSKPDHLITLVCFIISPLLI